MPINNLSDLITAAKDLDVSQLRLGPVKTNNHGGKAIKILGKNNAPLTLKIPLMFTWGISKMLGKEDPTKVNYSLPLVFQGGDGTPELDHLREQLDALDEFVINAMMENCREWFAKPKMGRDVAEDKYYRTLKYPKDKDSGMEDKTRDPSLRVKINNWDNIPNTTIFNMDRELIYKKGMPIPEEFETLIPRSRVATVVQCNGIWVSASGCGITWKLTQAMVRPQPQLGATSECLMDFDDLDAQLDAAKKADAKMKPRDDEDDYGMGGGGTVTPAVAAVDTTVADSDDEGEAAAAGSGGGDDSDSDSEDDTPPPKAPAKKVAAKKAPAKKVAKKTTKKKKTVSRDDDEE